MRHYRRTRRPASAHRHKATPRPTALASVTRVEIEFTFDDLPEWPTWMAEARCRAVPDPEIFYPERGQSLEPARAVCAGCGVQAECLAFALADDDCAVNGIWAATSPQQRRAMLRERKRRRAA